MYFLDTNLTARIVDIAKVNLINVYWTLLNFKHLKQPPLTLFCVCGIDIAQSQGWQPIFIPIFASWGILHASKSLHSASSQTGQVRPRWLRLSCKLTPSDLKLMYVSDSVMISLNWHTVYISQQTWSRVLISGIAPSAGTRRPCPASAREQDIFSSLIVT